MTAAQALGLLVLVAVSVAANLAWRGYRDRVEGGRFARVSRPEGPGLETTLGTIWVDERAGKLWIERRGGSPSFVWLHDIERVNVAIRRAEAALEELLLEGWRLTDFMRRYRDFRTCWEVSLLTKHSSVLVAELSQYKKRDFMDFSTPIQHWILAKLGYYRKGEEVVTQLRRALDDLLKQPVARAKAGARHDSAR